MPSNGSEPQINRGREAVLFLVRLIIGLSLIYLIFRNVDVNRVVGLVKNVDVPVFILSYVTILLGAVPSAVSWRVLMQVQGIGVPFVRIVYMNLVGFFFNSYLPTGIGGDVWRGYTLARVSGQTGSSVASLFMERLTAFASIVLLALISLIANYSLFEKYRVHFLLSLIFFMMALIFFVFLFLGPGLMVKGEAFLRRFFPGMVSRDVLDILEKFRNRPGAMALALLFALISPLLECVTYILIIYSLKLNVSYLPVFMLVPLLRFINHIPISVNSLGTQDLAMVLFWKPMGLSADQAFSVSLLMHFLRLTVGMTGGLIYILFPYRSESDQTGYESNP